MLILFLLDVLFWGFYLLIVIHSVLSWFAPYGRQPWRRHLAALVEPMLRPIRKLLPPTGGLDFSPLIACLLLGLIQSLLARALVH